MKTRKSMWWNGFEVGWRSRDNKNILLRIGLLMPLVLHYFLWYHRYIENDDESCKKENRKGACKMGQKKSRVEYIDIAKGLSIFFVIMGHAANNLDEPFYRVLFYTFHMPLFFMLSGILMKPKENYGLADWKGIIRKNLLVLVVPYFIWGLLYSQFSYVNFVRIMYGSWKSLTNAGTLTSLWYIPCLFLVRLEVHLLFWLYKKIKVDSRILAAITSVISFAIGFLLPYIETPGYVWCFDISFVALGFVLLGYAAKDIFKKISELAWYWLLLGLVISIGFFLIGTVFRREDLDLVLMCGSIYGDTFWFFWNAFTGSAATLFIAFISAQRNVFHLKESIKYIGRNTFAIYILHKPILQKLILGFFGLFGFDAFDFWIVAIASLITLVICCWLTRAIEKYIPQLLGKFPAPDPKVVDNAEVL